MGTPQLDALPEPVGDGAGAYEQPAQPEQSAHTSSSQDIQASLDSLDSRNIQDNPFYAPNQTPWLDRGMIMPLASRLAALVEPAASRWAAIPWLKEAEEPVRLASALVQLSLNPTQDADGTLVGRIHAWSAPLTVPIAQAIGDLYGASVELPRSVLMVDQILQRWAREARKPPLTLGHIVAICAFLHYLCEHEWLPPTPAQGAAQQHWRLEIRPVACAIRGWPAVPWVIRLCAGQQTLHFRLTPTLPQAREMIQVCYEALLHQAPPQRLVTPLGSRTVVPHVMSIFGYVPAALTRYAKHTGIRLLEEPLTVLPEPLQVRRTRCESVAHLAYMLDKRYFEEGGRAPFAERMRQEHFQGNEGSVEAYLRLVPSHLVDLLPCYPAWIAADGSIDWRGYRYHEYARDLFHLFAGERVGIRPVPETRALLLVEWRRQALGIGVADELRCGDAAFDALPAQSGQRRALRTVYRRRAHPTVQLGLLDWDHQ